jgi:hypothetical protein
VVSGETVTTFLDITDLAGIVIYASSEMASHFKRSFWKGEHQAGRRVIRKEAQKTIAHLD